MWRDYNVEMWLEFVGVDLQDLPKLCKASKLGATLTRFSGRRFNSEFCQHIIDLMGGSIDVPQLAVLCHYISTKLRIFDALSSGCEDQTSPKQIKMSKVIVGLQFQGYYVHDDVGATGTLKHLSLPESSVSLLLHSFPIFNGTSLPENGFTFEDFILICILVEFTAVRQGKGRDDDDLGKNLFPEIEKWAQSFLKYTKIPNETTDSIIKKTRRVAVVTGANRGLGFGIVKKLCHEFDGDVYLTCRDPDRGKEAVENLKTEGLNPKFHALDLTSAESIAKIRAHLERDYGGLDILINNAATAFLHTGTLAEDIQTAEATIGCNYFGTLELCKELFPLLRPYARVVTIVSSCGVFAVTGNEAKSKLLRKKLGDPNLTVSNLNDIMTGYLHSVRSNTVHEDGWQDLLVSSNNISKIGLQALTSIQQKEIDRIREKDGIAVNSYHPGLIQTEKAAAFKGPMLTVDQAAVGPVLAATLPPGPTIPKGKFLWTDLKPIDWVNGPIPWCY